MDERQLIKKIKELKQIKPNEDWVCFNKREILGEGLEKSETSPFSVLFIPIQKPALVLSSLVMVAAVLGGVFVYLNFIPQVQPSISTKAPEKQIAVSLEELQASLEKITLGLSDLKNAKDPSQALVMAEIVKATAKNGEEIVGQYQALASLVGPYREIREVAGNTQVEMMGDYIEDLKQRTLTEEDEARLEKAEEYYNEGKYTEVIFLIQKIGQ